MDLFLIVIVLVFAFFLIQWRKSVVGRDESEALAAEIDKDFKLDFERDSKGDLTPRGMEDLVLWCEDDMRDQKLNQASEIEDFEELN